MSVGTNNQSRYGRSDLSLSATFHWPFSRDGQLVAIISYANDLSLVFSLILLLCSLLVGLLFYNLDPSSKLCGALSWIFDFSLMFILSLHGYSGWTISIHTHYFHSHHSFMPCLSVHRHHFSLFFFFSFFLSGKKKHYMSICVLLLTICQKSC